MVNPGLVALATKAGAFMLYILFAVVTETILRHYQNYSSSGVYI